VIISSNNLSVARDLAEKAGVPIVPGTKGLVESTEEAAQESERLGFPVMLKGMHLSTYRCVLDP
jgi:biotin carboxylase